MTVTTTTGASPVASPAGPPPAASYERLAAAYPALRIRCAPPRTGDGWTTGAALAADPAALREMIDFDARAGERDYGTPLRPDVAAGFSLHRYLWPVALAFTLPWFLERRVPRLPADAVAIRRASGELRVRPVELTGLPDDPLAGTGLLRVVPDEAALRRTLLDALAEHLTPVVTAFRPTVRRGSRTLWGMATDDVVEGLRFLGGLLGEEDRAVAELAELLPGDGPAPFVGGAGFRCTGEMRTRTRVTCCLFYTVRPDEMCFTCPRKQ
ncbi:(2Fe-2S)-binding protein [Kitasatospora sp. NBC_01539]|uniref:(2Fe-2S)-binding protein n=1 Tax=Kitasatospora sp. NBC_01539 TaxID=2903577 RepID=UPI0038602B9A